MREKIKNMTKEQIEEIIKAYIKENLSVSVRVYNDNRYYSGKLAVKVSVELCGEEISMDSDSIEITT